MTAFIVSLSLLAIGTAATKQAGKESLRMVGGAQGNGAAPQTAEGNRLVSDGDQAGPSAAGHSATATIESDPLAYWHSLAVKRLHLLGKRERRIVHLLGVVHKLRHGSRSHGTIAHRAGWLCIHSREGAWNAQTGNGFYGGLQMTYGWMGLVKNAALLSPDQQMAAAEEGYRRSGYSHAWLAGQWPNTYPPCAGLF